MAYMETSALAVVVRKTAFIQREKNTENNSHLASRGMRVRRTRQVGCSHEADGIYSSESFSEVRCDALAKYFNLKIY